MWVIWATICGRVISFNFSQSWHHVPFLPFCVCVCVASGCELNSSSSGNICMYFVGWNSLSHSSLSICLSISKFTSTPPPLPFMSLPTNIQNILLIFTQACHFFKSHKPFFYFFPWVFQKYLYIFFPLQRNFLWNFFMIRLLFIMEISKKLFFLLFTLKERRRSEGFFFFF